MRLQRFLALLVTCCAQVAIADELLYSYEAENFPQTSEGWFTSLGPTCTQSLVGGFLINSWPAGQGSYGGYEKFFGSTSSPPPDPPFWAEWRFSSNNAIHGDYNGDGIFLVAYDTASLWLNMFSDAIVSQDGGTYVLGLPLNTFRTYRFESPDGNQWCAWMDGKLFMCGNDGQGSGAASLIQMAGNGYSSYSAVNRWDYVRYGRLTTGETIVSANPPSGYLNPETYANLDRFTVNFDQPNYVYVNDVTVEVLSNQYRDREGAVVDTSDVRGSQHPALALGVPIVTATRRQDDGPPETVEIVLDRPLPVGQTTRFTFNTGAATPQTVEYTVAFDPHPVIPATTTWGLVVFALLLLIAAKVIQVASATLPRQRRA